MKSTLESSILIALVVASSSAPLRAEERDGAGARAKTTEEVLEATSPSDWRPLDPKNTLYVELSGGRVIIELARRFAPEHAKNIVTLAQEHYWDGLTVNRAQDNFVVQWGDAHRDDEKLRRRFRSAKASLPAEFDRKSDGLPFARLADVDGWAPTVGFVEGMPVAQNAAKNRAWLTHCYGMVGAARGMDADSSNGSELYVVIGHAPRQLDRNTTLVGRVVHGIEHLSTLPRGTGPFGFYDTSEGFVPGPGPRATRDEAPQRVPIQAVRLMADVPEAERTEIELLRTDTEAFSQLVEVRRNRREEWYKLAAGYVDLCSVPIPSRPVQK